MTRAKKDGWISALITFVESLQDRRKIQGCISSNVDWYSTKRWRCNSSGNQETKLKTHHQRHTALLWSNRQPENLRQNKARRSLHDSAQGITFAQTEAYYGISRHLRHTNGPQIIATSWCTLLRHGPHQAVVSQDRWELEYFYSAAEHDSMLLMCPRVCLFRNARLDRSFIVVEVDT